MNLYLDLPSPGAGRSRQAGQHLRPAKPRPDEPAPRLLEPAHRVAVRRDVFRGEARISHLGPLVVHTGKHTARAAADKFVVREHTTERPRLVGRVQPPVQPREVQRAADAPAGFLQGRDVFVQDCYAGADPDYRMPIRIITEKAWHSLFARNMFMKIRSTEDAQAPRAGVHRDLRALVSRPRR